MRLALAFLYLVKGIGLLQKTATTVYANRISPCGFWDKICIYIFPSTTFIMMFHWMQTFQCVSYKRFSE